VDQTSGQPSFSYAALSGGWERQSAIADHKACPAGGDTRAVLMQPEIVTAALSDKAVGLKNV